MKNVNPNIYFVIRNDDPCALSDAVKERRILSVFEKYNIPQVLAVVPKITEDPHNCRGNCFHPLEENPEMLSLLREYAAKGLIEIAQHGLTHQTNDHHPSRDEEISEDAWDGIDRKWLAFNPVKGEYSEFKGLTFEEKEARILEGKTYLEKLFEIDIETFVFPWNTGDKESIEVLKKCGFKNVLCGPNNFYNIKNLNTISHAREDFLEFPAPLNLMKQVHGQVLVHICYHSWMFDDPEMQRLDTLLETLVADQNVEFVTTKDLEQSGPEFKKMLSRANYATILSQQANRFLNRKISLEPFYVFNQSDVLRKMARAVLVVFLVKIIGLRKALILAGSITVVFLLFELFYRHGLVDVIPLILLLVVVMALSVINLRVMFSRRRK